MAKQTELIISTKTIDLTPTWSALIDPMLDAYAQQNDTTLLVEEFHKMAAAADRWNAYCKSLKE